MAKRDLKTILFEMKKILLDAAFSNYSNKVGNLKKKHFKKRKQAVEDEEQDSLKSIRQQLEDL